MVGNRGDETLVVVIMERFLNGVLVLLLVLVYILPAMFQSAYRFFPEFVFFSLQSG